MARRRVWRQGWWLVVGLSLLGGLTPSAVVAQPAVPIFRPAENAQLAPGACTCALTPRRTALHQAVTGVVESSSAFFPPPYDAGAAIDGDDLDNYAAHSTFGDYPNWFVVGLSALTDLHDIEIRWGTPTLYGTDFEVWAYLDTGAGFSWTRIIQEVGWAPSNGNALYVRRFASPYQRVCKLAFFLSNAAGQARTVMRRFAWNQLAELGATLVESSSFFFPPYDVLAALDGRNALSNYAAHMTVSNYPNWFQLLLARNVTIRDLEIHWYDQFHYGTNFQILGYRNGQWTTLLSEAGWVPADSAAIYSRSLPVPLADVESLVVIVNKAVGQDRALIRQVAWNRPWFRTLRYSSLSDFEHAEYPVVIKDASMYKMWYSGLSVVDGKWRIHYAVSGDGVTWQKYGVVLEPGATGAWDSSSVAFPFVVKDNSGHYHMWYGGTSTSNFYEIGHATSLNGINWTKTGSGPVFRRSALGARLIVDPTVVYDPTSTAKTFQIWIHAFPEGGGEDVYYASSADGASWTTPVRVTFDPPVPSYTIDVKREDTGAYTMYFAGGVNRLDIYRTTSADGLTWGSATLLLAAPSSNPEQWDSYADYGMSVLDDNGVRRMWFNGAIQGEGCDGSAFGTGHIGTATEANGVWVKDSLSPVLRAGSVTGE